VPKRANSTNANSPTLTFNKLVALDAH